MKYPLLIATSAILLLTIGCEKSDPAEDTSASTTDQTSTETTEDTDVETDETTGGTDDSATEPTDTTASTDDTSTTTADVTWHADISPVLQTYCGRCHYDGGLGTGDFSDYATAAAFAEIMLTQIDAGQMPPAASDPECRDYRGSEHMFLPSSDRDLLQAWVEEGTPEGDPADAVEVEAIDELLDDPDIEVRTAAAYTPTFSDTSNPGNEYRCFVLDPGLEEDTFMTAMQPIIDNRQMVHHVVLYTRNSRTMAPEDADADGFDCINGEEFSYISAMVGGWAPGSLPIELEEWGGMRLRAGEQFIVQMHYYDPGDLTQTDDHSGYAFRFADSVEKEIYTDIHGSYAFNIPANDDSYSVQGSSSVPFGRTTTIYSVFPHMHVLGSGFRMWVEGPEEETCMVYSESYDFENQQTYLFEEPLEIPGGSTIRTECTWNNSASNPDIIHDPPRDTRYGERTDEEMCFFFALTSIE